MATNHENELPEEENELNRIFEKNRSSQFILIEALIIMYARADEAEPAR